MAKSVVKKVVAENTPKRKPGKGAMNGKLTGKCFTKDRQPTKEQRIAGWDKKKKAQELVKAVLQLSFKGKQNSKLKKDAAQYFGIPEKDITVETMLVFKQAEKAIQKGDTHAFSAVMDRAFGKPKEKIEVKDTTPLEKLPVKFS